MLYEFVMIAVLFHLISSKQLLIWVLTGGVDEFYANVWSHDVIRHFNLFFY